MIRYASLEERYETFCATHPQRQADCGRHNWPFRQGGSSNAPAVLLLPGALGRPETGFEYADALEPYFRVISPGYPATAKTMASLADGAAALLEACGVDRAHIVGGSFGGLVAQALLDRHPQRVGRLVLSDTSPPVPARARRMRLAASAIRALPERVVRAVLQFGVGRYVASLPSDSRRFWRQHFAEMLKQLTKPEVENRARAWAEFDRSRNCTHPLTPSFACEGGGTDAGKPILIPPPSLAREGVRGWVQVLCAESDHAVSADRLRARFPQATVHIVASPLGHAASIGDAPAYIAPMLGFLTAEEGT